MKMGKKKMREREQANNNECVKKLELNISSHLVIDPLITMLKSVTRLC